MFFGIEGSYCVDCLEELTVDELKRVSNETGEARCDACEFDFWTPPAWTALFLAALAEDSVS